MASRKASPGIGIATKSIVLHRTTQLTTTDLVGMFAWRPPQNIQVLGFSVVARAKGGTHASTVFDLMAGATLVASVNLTAVAAGAVGEAATIASENVAADTLLTVNFTETGGTTPTLDDVSVQIDYIERS